MKGIENLKSERGTYTVNGGKVLVFGDLHFSSSFTGSHISYVEECFMSMQKILQIVREEQPSAIVFEGDLCGVSELTIKDRQFLTRVLMFFATLYNITKGNVYSVKGNHEMGDFSDFDMLISLGYIKNPQYVDYYGDEDLEVRFHFVNYGDEHKPLKLEKEGASNVVFGHAEYYIEGVTQYYSKKAGVELNKLSNFNGVDLVFSGHIHVPSTEMLYTTLPNGESVGLFFTGSPSRTFERYDDCWYVKFFYDEDQKSTSYDAQLMGLLPAGKIFHDKEELLNEEGIDEEDKARKEDERQRTENLDIIIKEIMDSRITTGDLFKQIDIIPGADVEKELAKEYIRKAMEVEK